MCWGVRKVEFMKVMSLMGWIVIIMEFFIRFNFNGYVYKFDREMNDDE